MLNAYEVATMRYLHVSAYDLQVNKKGCILFMHVYVYIYISCVVYIYIASFVKYLMFPYGPSISNFYLEDRRTQVYEYHVSQISDEIFGVH